MLVCLKVVKHLTIGYVAISGSIDLWQVLFGLNFGTMGSFLPFNSKVKGTIQKLKNNSSVTAEDNNFQRYFLQWPYMCLNFNKMWKHSYETQRVHRRNRWRENFRITEPICLRKAYMNRLQVHMGSHHQDVLIWRWPQGVMKEKKRFPRICTFKTIQVDCSLLITILGLGSVFCRSKSNHERTRDDDLWVSNFKSNKPNDHTARDRGKEAPLPSNHRGGYQNDYHRDY